MPSYSSHLLANQNYCFIKHQLSDKYLVRHTQSKDFIDLQTNNIIVKQVCSPSEQLEDLSTNLLANFTIKDLIFEIINEGGNKEYFTRYWNEGEIVNKVPLFEKDFRFNNERGFFFLSIKEIDGLYVPYSVGGVCSDNFRVICRVVHTPTNNNFWHFSLRWYNEKGEDLREIKGNFKNRLFTNSRSLISEMAEYELPKYEPLPKVMYVKE